MGLLKKEPKESVTEILPVHKEINTIISIMNNLSLLDTKKIELFLKNEGIEFDKSILNRLMISVDENKLEKLKKYYDPSNLGYGDIKLFSIDLINELLLYIVLLVSASLPINALYSKLIYCSFHIAPPFSPAVFNLNTEFLAVIVP